MRRDGLLLAALLLPLLVAPLLWPPIGAHGEAREGLVVQDIVEHGEWVLPRRNGALPSKPPFFHWLAAALGGLLGVSDATIRFPSALAAGILATTTFGLGAALGGRAAGWLSVGALLGMLAFWLPASDARVDMVFAACVTISLAGFAHWYRAATAGGHTFAARAACYLGAACAVLAKGPAGLALPGLVIAIFLAWQGELRMLVRLWSWPLAAALAVLDVGWYALAVAAGGRDFVVVQLLHENVDRFFGRGTFARAARQPGFKHFVLRMPLDFARHFFPWNVFAVGSLVRGGKDAGDRFLHVWWIAVLVVFSLATGKRAVYLLPLAPPIAVLAGRALASGPIVLRRSPRVVVAVVAGLDVAIFLTAQGIRAYHAKRRSLLEFTRAVERVVPRDVPIYAARGVEPPAILVLAYRLDRRIRPAPAECVDGDFLLALPGRERGDVLATAERGHTPVSLVRRRCTPSD